MFLIPPNKTSLSSSCTLDEILQLGDSQRLFQGLRVNEKGNRCGKLIRSLRELELRVEYVTERGFELKRISDRKLIIRRTSSNNPSSKIMSTPIPISSGYSNSPSYRTPRPHEDTSPVEIPSAAGIRIPAGKHMVHRHKHSLSDGSDSSESISGSRGKKFVIFL